MSSGPGNLLAPPEATRRRCAPAKKASPSDVTQALQLTGSPEKVRKVYVAAWNAALNEGVTIVDLGLMEAGGSGPNSDSALVAGVTTTLERLGRPPIPTQSAGYCRAGTLEVPNGESPDGENIEPVEDPCCD